MAEAPSCHPRVARGAGGGMNVDQILGVFILGFVLGSFVADLLRGEA